MALSRLVFLGLASKAITCHADGTEKCKARSVACLADFTWPASASCAAPSSGHCSPNSAASLSMSAIGGGPSWMTRR